MKKPMILILLLAFACIAYTAWRFWLIVPFSKAGKWVFTAVYMLCFAAVFIHYAAGNRMPMWLAAASYEIGTSWMIFFLYALLVFAVLGVGRLLHLIPGSFLKDSIPGACTVLGMVAVLLAGGYLHYHHKYREVIDIQTEKPLTQPLTIVLASDLHAGYHNRAGELARWVDMINAENPDMVLFAGDVLDGEIRPALEWNYANVFSGIQAPVYATLGNHEYMTGADASAAFFAAAGINLLRDATVTAKGIRIIGRDDRSNSSRRPLGSLAPADSLFTILLDHQPYHLEEAERAGIDFQFSGHTHHGQVWPGNWVTDAMYEKAFGAHRRGGTQYYVSSGLGIWGGKFRIGTRSEYVVLRISAK